jgi:CBS-domain-containing membrane protein
MNRGDVCTEDTGVKEVYELIQHSSNGYVVVIDSLKHRVPIGIVSEHSICKSMVLRDRSPRSLDAGGVMNTNIKRVRDDLNIEDWPTGIDEEIDMIVVVDERRRFLGTVDLGDLERSVENARRFYRAPTIFSGTLEPHAPPAVEIPAFGWLK